MSALAEQPRLARPLNDLERQAKRDIMPVLERDRVQVLLNQPFLGTLAMRMELVPVVDARLPTAATDGERLFFNALFMQKLSAHDRRFVIAHEIWHCAALHFPRRGNRDPGLWNIAIDHETNHILNEMGLKVPADAVHFPRLGGKNAETVYSWLQDRNRSSRQTLPGRGKLADQHDPDQAGAMPFPPADSEHGLPIDTDFNPRSDSGTWQRWPRRVVSAAQQVEHGYGSQPDWLSQLLELIGEPTIPWQEHLRRFVERSRDSEYRWTRPNRRFISQGLFLPGHETDRLDLAVGIDTSGSTGNALPDFMAEIKGIVSSYARWRVRIIACDTRVVLDESYSDANPPPASLAIQAGGGTDLQPVIDRLLDEPPTALIYLTDGFAPAPTRPDFPVLWTLTPGGQTPAPWGETLRLPGRTD
ncbi:MAG: hypothetical protein EA370_12320 [Wenzhouxiangella sp.]|nr:MAG: hypothetical protein EA370_12320 [Wenzhouxiangella sp.]